MRVAPFAHRASAEMPVDRVEIGIRRAAPGDTGRILELVRASLGEGSVPRDARFWEWKHRANPFGESPVLLAEATGELVGLRAFLRWEWRLGGRTYRAVRAVDTATHPAWQGRGIFSRLTLRLVEELREEGVDFVFNTPNRKSGPGYLKMGWRALGRTNLWVRPLAVAKGRRPPAPGDGDGDPAPPGHAAVDVLAGDGIGEWLATLPGDPRRFRTPRTLEYLRWRYAGVPGIRYGAAAGVREDGGALVVYRVRARGPRRELRFCEVLVGGGPGAGGAARRLVREACRASGADFATAMAAWGTPEARVLLGCGFVPAPRIGPLLTVRPLALADAELPVLCRRASWAGASIGDLELF